MVLQVVTAGNGGQRGSIEGEENESKDGTLRDTKHSLTGWDWILVTDTVWNLSQR